MLLYTREQYTQWTMTRDLVHEACRLLSQVCDGARAHDRQGFNAADTEFGHSLAGKKVEWLTARQVSAALRMLTKYSKQLVSMAGDALDFKSRKAELSVPEPRDEWPWLGNGVAAVTDGEVLMVTWECRLHTEDIYV